MIFQSLRDQLNDLQKLLREIDNTVYTKKSTMLGEATLGQHVRHIIELVQCLVQGYATGAVDYDARKRDTRIESDTDFAIAQLTEITDSISLPEKSLVLIQPGQQRVETFYHREVVYNTEHTIHHMALIRVALREMQLDIVDDHFGVAPATIQYRSMAHS